MVNVTFLFVNISADLSGSTITTLFSTDLILNLPYKLFNINLYIRAKALLPLFLASILLSYKSLTKSLKISTHFSKLNPPVTLILYPHFKLALSS